MKTAPMKECHPPATEPAPPSASIAPRPRDGNEIRQGNYRVLYRSDGRYRVYCGSSSCCPFAGYGIVCATCLAAKIAMAAAENSAGTLEEQAYRLCGQAGQHGPARRRAIGPPTRGDGAGKARRLGPSDRRRRGGIAAGRDWAAKTTGSTTTTRRQVDEGRDRGHHRNATLAAAGAGRCAARHPPAVHAGHAGRLVGRARGGDSPLASAGIDRAGARGAAAAVFRFSGGGHRPAAGRTVGGGRFAPGDREAACGRWPAICPTWPGRWPSCR